MRSKEIEGQEPRPKAKRQLSLDSGFSLQRRQSIDKALVRMLALDLQPASIVDRGFREFVAALDGNYQLPRRRSLMRNDLPQLHGEIVKIT